MTRDFKMTMFKRGIESNRQALTAYVTRHGFKEELGQPEYREFTDKVNASDELTMADKAALCSSFTEMINNL